MKLRFFSVVASSLVIGYPLQATDVISPHEDSKRCPPSHYSQSSYGSSSNDFNDPHPGQEGTTYSAQMPKEEYVLDEEAMKRLWQGMSRNPLTQEQEEKLSHDMKQQKHLQIHLLSALDTSNYIEKLTQVLNFRTNNTDLIRQAVNEVSVDILRKTKNLKPKGLHIPALQTALSEQIATCEDLMRTPFGANSAIILGHLIDALIDNFRCETDISKLNNELQPRIISNLKLLKQKEVAQKSENLNNYKDLLEKFKKSLEDKDKIFTSALAK